MIDHFAALSLPRRPWIDGEELKDRFHRLSAEQHPDVARTEPGGDFSRLTKAYAVLKDAATRLRHLLELEYPDLSTPQQIPPTLVEQFMKVATLQREIQVFAHQQSTATALTRALAASEGFSLQRDVEKAIAVMEVEVGRALELLQMEDTLWEKRDEQTGPRLAHLHQELAFLTKWTADLRERLMLLQG
jgi:DnaJ-domain-containing protein 1